MSPHIYRVLMENMIDPLTSNELFDEIFDYCIRVESQRRGTLHIHVIAWAILQPGVSIEGRLIDTK